LLSGFGIAALDRVQDLRDVAHLALSAGTGLPVISSAASRNRKRAIS
jgi:hypothetical protein